MQPRRNKNKVTIFATAFACLPKNKKQQLHFYIGYYAISFWDAKYTFSIIEPFNSQKWLT